MAKLTNVTELAASAERIVYGGTTFERTDADPKSGDIIRYVGGPRSYLTVGAYYAVRGARRNMSIIDDTGDAMIGPVDEARRRIVFTPVEQAVQPAPTVKVGDYVVITKYQSAAPVGTVVAVTGVRPPYSPGSLPSIDYRYNGRDGWGSSQYTVKSSAPSKRFKVGDYAKVTSSQHEYKAGDIVKITGFTIPFSYFDYAVERQNVKSPTQHTGYASDSFLTVATDAEIRMATDPRSAFAVGDKVRLISGGDEWPLYGYGNGGVYEVNDPASSHSSGTRIKIRKIDSYAGGGYALPSQLVKLSAKEIAAIEAETAAKAVTAKWSAIGRKVDEYKVGDVVKYVKDGHGGNHGLAKHIGTITTIDGLSPAIHLVNPFGTGGFNTYTFPSEIELIAPVESLFTK